MGQWGGGEARGAYLYPWAGLWGEQYATSTVTHLSLETQGIDVRIDTFFSKQTKANRGGL